MLQIPANVAHKLRNLLIVGGDKDAGFRELGNSGDHAENRGLLNLQLQREE